MIRRVQAVGWGNGLSIAHAEPVTVGTLRFAHPTGLC
jgi:hypothetical protein